ncbi:expressed unknown protein [Seminavis robusta]|uniref:Uncharacterized protein n=1 Tax=Seminavis robusta TaxID=568900 RepID=A0A9N8D957_9STRA|nr:expressed unknown protein [Seminavis robusta]|eukprot:Sro6_g005000.1 n/a (445) ;mRNA; f:71083-72417
MVASVVVIRSIDDLVSAVWSPERETVDTLHFQITKTQLPHRTFQRFVELFSLHGSRFEHVTAVILDADVYWTRTAARDFMTQLATLPLQSFTWVSTTTTTTSTTGEIPIPLLTILCTHCQGLERLVLDGLRFLTSTVEERIQEDGTTSHVSETLVPFHQALRSQLANLKLFQCVHCVITEPGSSASSSNNNILMDRLWVDELLKSLAYVTSLECMDIRVQATIDDDGDAVGGRILLGLCKKGDITDAAVNRLTRQILQAQIPSGGHGPYQRMRLWIANGYGCQDDDDGDDGDDDADDYMDQSQQGGDSYSNNQHHPEQLLLDICRALENNTFLEGLRVRGGSKEEASPSLIVTSAVIDAYKELLESGKNYALTCCDLMTIQGEQIDLYCKLNSMDRGYIMKEIDSMNQRDWVEDVLLDFVDDLDALYYWNRLHPLLLTQHIVLE